ncbi:MAG: hypothetical protein C0593_06915 [Marinilabiliales bacterium]|nr:MAG: hypothetical protein C0593_06915 [Marinilabiliales bacterium]
MKPLDGSWGAFWLLVVGCWLLVVGCWLAVDDDPTGIFLLSGLEDNDVKSFHCCRVVGSTPLAHRGSASLAHR